jgi:hypothetical protein
MRVNLTSIPYQKYKRVFAFGCSFTEYIWPTWANVLQYEMPQAEFYNWGKTGGGNVYIASMVMAINQKYKFTSDDLVMIMWSTHCREDRYIKTSWLTPGNIFTQNYYSEDFIKQFSCAKGYLVRDLAYMTAIKYALQSMPCDYFMLRSVDVRWDDKHYLGDDFENVIDLYKDVIDDFPEVLYESVKNGKGGWINGHQYDWPGLDYKSPKFLDYHPNPKMYMDYLMHIGFNISEKTQNYVKQLTNELHAIDHRPTIEEWFKNFNNKNHPNYYWGLHLV